MNLKALKTRGRHLRFYCLLGLLMGLITVKYSLLIDIPRILFLGIILLIVVTGDRNEIIAMSMCCIPLHESVDFFYAITFCVLAYILKYPRSIRFNLTLIPVVLIVSWELLHCFGKQIAPVLLISELLPFLTILVFLSMDLTDTDYGFTVRTFAATTALAGLSMLLRVVYTADFNFAIAFANLQRLGVQIEDSTISSGAIHPNALGIICVLTITGLMQLRTAGRGNKTDLVLSILLIVQGALTASRTFVVCLTLMGILLLFSQKGSIWKKLRFLGILLLVLALALLILGLIFPELLEYFYKRFLEVDITTGRMGLMQSYHEFIVSNPRVLFFGLGLHGLAENVTEVYRVASNVPHNGIQEIIVAWGWPGLVLFAGLVFFLVWRSRQLCRRQQLLNYIPLLILMLKIQAGQMITSGYTMLVLVYAYLSLAENFEKRTPT